MPGRKGGARRVVEEPSNYEQALASASHALEQAERYQAGQKAERHYAEARRFFEMALAMQPGDAEASYHLGRALYAIATFEAAPACVATMRQSIQAYKAALAAETQDDTAYNLAQSLVTLGEFVSDGAVDEPEAELVAWREAMDVLSTTEHLQRAMLNQATLPSEMQEADDSTSESVDSVSPAAIVETLISKIDVLGSIYAATSDAEERSRTWEALEEAVESAQVLDADDAYQSAASIAQAQALATVARVEADFYVAAAPPHVDALFSAIETLEKVISSAVSDSEKPVPLELATDLADARATAADVLLRFACSLSTEEANDVRGAALEQLKQAFDAYGDIVARLSASVLQANHGVPAHLVPGLYAAAQCARSRLLLLLAISSPSLLEGAMDVAIKAIEVCGAGLTFKSAEKAFSRAASGRSDWSTMKALREATLCLARAGFSDLGVIARLLKLSGASSRQVGAYVADELEGDAIWQASAGAEQNMWQRVIGALEAEHAVAAAQAGR